jgi:hypothetical protein
MKKYIFSLLVAVAIGAGRSLSGYPIPDCIAAGLIVFGFIAALLLFLDELL